MTADLPDDSPLLETIRKSRQIAERAVLSDLRARVWTLQTTEAHIAANQTLAGDDGASRTAGERSGAFSDVVRLIDEELRKLT